MAEGHTQHDMARDVREWIERQRASHARADDEEIARIRQMTPTERWKLQRALCRSAMEGVLALPEDQRQKVLEYRDPLPASSEAALKRLRADYAARRGTASSGTSHRPGDGADSPPA